MFVTSKQGGFMAVKLKRPVTVFKKVYSNGLDVIATLVLVPGTLVNRSLKIKPGYPGNRPKFRANQALVVNLRDEHGATLDKAYSGYNPLFVYRLGERVVPPLGKFDMTDTPCASGIHFYLTRQ